MSNILPSGVVPSRITPITISSIRERNERRPVDRSFIREEEAMLRLERDILDPVIVIDDMTPPRNYANPIRTKTLLSSPMDQYALNTAVNDFIYQTNRAYDPYGSKFAANETIRGLRSIGAGEYGNVYQTRDGLYTVKHEQRDKASSIHELFIGRKLVSLRDRTPIFSATLGAVSCSDSLFNAGNQLWCRKGDDQVDLVVYEYVNGVKATEFESEDPLDYFAIYVMILHGLQLAFDEYQFTHHDLHGSNVLIEELEEPMLFRITNNLYVLTRYIPHIIDYGFSRVTFDLSNYAKPYNNGQGPLSANIILDAFRFFMSRFFKRDANAEYNRLLHQLTRMFTGYAEDYFEYRSSLDALNLNPVFDDKLNAGKNVWAIIETIVTSIPSIFFTQNRARIQQTYRFYQCGTPNRPECLNSTTVPPIRITFSEKPDGRVEEDIDDYTRYANWVFSLDRGERTREKETLRRLATLYEDEDTLMALTDRKEFIQ